MTEDVLEAYQVEVEALQAKKTMLVEKELPKICARLAALQDTYVLEV